VETVGGRHVGVGYGGLDGGFGLGWWSLGAAVSFIEYGVFGGD